jgi:DNA-binding transcriptional ArsR family regulator
VDADVAGVAALFADRTRAAALALLVSGRAHTAGELARAAAVPASTMAGHLSRLLDAGAVAVEAQGRHRYYRLADPRLAAVFEALAEAAPAAPPRSLTGWRRSRELRHARTCYDHLAGEVAVAVTAALLDRGELTRDRDRFELSPAGADRLAAAGVDVTACRRQRRRFAYPCLDWSERTAHLGGALGAGLLAAATDAGWLRPHAGSRAVGVTDTGVAAFGRHFGLDPALLRAGAGGGQPRQATSSVISNTTSTTVGTSTRSGSTR